jgi:hypothetical protein
VGVGRWILTLGLITVGIGLLVMAAERFSFFRLGRLPGDIVYRRENVTIYIPLATSLLLSLVLTLVLWAIRKRS